MTLEQFIQLPEHEITIEKFYQLSDQEQKEFMSMVFHCIKHEKYSLRHAVWFVGLNKNNGLFDTVKHFSEGYSKK